MVIYSTSNSQFGTSGLQKLKLSTGSIAPENSNKSNDAMPYDGKFTEFRFLQRQNWKGTITLQKNNVDTALSITITENNDNVVKKVKANVPFVAGDTFRYNVNTTAIGGADETYMLLFGGLNVTN